MTQITQIKIKKFVLFVLFVAVLKLAAFAESAGRKSNDFSSQPIVPSIQACA